MRVRVPAAVAALLLLSACGEDGPVGPDSNRSPEIRSVTVSPAVIPLGGTATVRVDAVDPDGDALFFRYEASGGTFTTDPALPGTATYRNDGVARSSDSIRVVVTDRSNASASGTAAVTLQANRPPTVRATALLPEAECHPRCELTVEALAEDPDGDELSYVWSGCASGTRERESCTIPQPGDYTAAVTVSDGRGGVASASVDLRGTNRPPIVQGTAQVFAAGTWRILVAEEDPDDDPMVCGWHGDCQCTGSVQSYNLICQIPPTVNRCFERFLCTDPFGASGERRFELFR
jgi:hypothetical protein